MFEKIKKWYKWGLWTKEMVEKAVKNKIITVEQAVEILGE